MASSSSVLTSVYSLAKNNNGFFKSEKQASFLISVLSERNGLFVESFSFGEYNGASASRDTMISWDANGITEIKTKAAKSGKTKVLFSRVDASIFEAKQAAKAQEIAQAKAERDQWYANKFAELGSAIDAEKLNLVNVLDAISAALVAGTMSEKDASFMAQYLTEENGRKIAVLEKELASEKALYSC